MKWGRTLLVGLVFFLGLVDSLSKRGRWGELKGAAA